MVLLRTLDLFSGVGGITYALEGLATPVAYCDWAKESQAALDTLQRRKLLPRAPTCTDVRALDRQWLRENCGPEGTKIDMIVGGFPCVGFSSVGSLQAFDNAESALFSEILRLADELRVPLLFLENVSNILNLGMEHVTHELVTKRGYELRWTVAPASFMGAPHKRSRWFCLAVKPGFQYRWARASAFAPYPWGKMREPPRCVSPKLATRTNPLRRGMLGNSVVPDAVRYAFLFMATRCAKVPATLSTPSGFVLSPAPARKGGSSSNNNRRVTFYPRGGWPTNGILTASREAADVRAPLPPFRAPLRRQLIFDPKVYKSPVPPSDMITTGILTKPIVRHTWATPRHGSLHGVNFLTGRCKGDLYTQVRFERSTPDSLRGGTPSVNFVEYLMGYPLGWTATSMDDVARK